MKAWYIGLLILFLPVAGFSQSLSLADSLHKRGMKYRNAGHYDRASEFLGRAYHLYKKQSVDSIWIPAGFDYVISLEEQNKSNQAFQLLGSLNKTSYTKHHITLQAKIEIELGLLYSHISKEDSALKHYKIGLN